MIRTIWTILVTFIKALFKPSPYTDEAGQRMLESIKREIEKGDDE